MRTILCNIINSIRYYLHICSGIHAYECSIHWLTDQINNSISLSHQPSLPQELKNEAQSIQNLPCSNPFLQSPPTENHNHPAEVQDAPLALITKPRSHKPLLEATNPAFSSPINLSTAARSSALPKPGQKTGQRIIKREKTSLVESIREVESELMNNKDSDDSLMEDEDENDASDDSVSG